MSAAAVCVVVSACGGSSAEDHSSPAATKSLAAPIAASVAEPERVGWVSVMGLERALMGHGREPPTPTMPEPPTTADRRASSPAERASVPFGHTRLPLLTCALTDRGQLASYALQVLPDGCFIAERVRRGQAVYGCDRSLRNGRLEREFGERQHST